MVVVVVELVVIVFDNDCVYVWCQGGDCCNVVEPLVVYIVDNDVDDYNSILMNLFAVVDNYYYSHNSDNHDDYDNNDSQLDNFFHVVVVVEEYDDNSVNVDNNIVVVVVIVND